MVNKKRLSIILRFIVSFGLLVGLIWIMRRDIRNIVGILKNSNKLFFIVALCINIPLTILLAYRLKLLMHGQKILLPMKDVIYLTFIGFFFNNFLPTAIGGDIVKAYYASKKTNNKLASYTAVLSDRLFGFLAILLIAIIGLIFIGKTLDNKKIIYAVGLISVLLVSVLFILFKKSGTGMPVSTRPTGMVNKIRENMSKLYYAVNTYRDNPLLLIKIFSLSIFMQACSIVAIYFIILCVGGNTALLKLFLIIPIVWAICMLPSLNGLGVLEGAFVYFLKPDIGSEKAFAVSILWLSIVILYSLIGGVMHLFYPVKIKLKNNM